MAYAVTSDVKKYIAKLKISDATFPNENQVDEIIADIANEIDFALMTVGYILPIDNSAETALGFIKKLCAIGTCGYVILSRFPETEYGKGVGSLALKYIGIYDNAIKKIISGDYQFAEIPTVPGSIAAGKYGIPLSNYDTNNIPIFTHEDIIEFKDSYELEI